MTELRGAETVAVARYLYGKLSGISGANGAHAGLAPKGTQMPYVTYQYWPRPDGGDVAALGGVRVLARMRYLVKVIARTSAEAEPFVRAIDQALRNDPDVPPAQQDGYSILNVRRVEPFEMPTQEGDEQYWQSGGYYDLEVTTGV